MEHEHWTARHGKPIIFVILTFVAAGIYLAMTIPVAVFPEVDFPRVLVDVDNGVAPIDQMMVTITRPIEEAVNSVQGLERVQSITSRGSAEIDLFFSWKVDMFQTLERVNAALARVQAELPATAKLRADRLTFAAFPIIGYSLTSETVPMTRLWELATYELKPRLNRMLGVSTIVVQGGQEPEFEVRPDPAKLLQTQTNIPAVLDAIGRSNMIDSPGLFESRHQLVLSLVSGQARARRELQPDDARRPRGGRRSRDRRCDRRRREHRDAPRRGPVARRRHSQRDCGNSRAAGGLDHHADRRLPAARLDHRRDRHLLPRARRDRRHGAAHVAGARADVDADALALFHPRPRDDGNATAARRGATASDAGVRTDAAHGAQAAADARCRHARRRGGRVRLLPRARIRSAARNGRGRL